VANLVLPEVSFTLKPYSLCSTPHPDPEGPDELLLFRIGLKLAGAPFGGTLALVEVDGIEPTTPCLQSRCSPTELHPRFSKRLRQGDIRAWCLVGQGGLEPPTSRLSSARSNQLSY